LIVLTILVSLCVTPPRAEPRTASYIVQGASVESVVELVAAYHGEISSRLDIINGVAAILPVESVAALRQAEGITSIVPNSPVQVAGDQGNWEIPATDYPDVIGADLAWEQGDLGQGVTVAVIDTGIGNHPGLMKDAYGNNQNRIIGWVDFVDQKRAPNDPNGHGTQIAGIIANSEAGADDEWNGVAPGVNLVGVRVLNSHGYGTYEKVIQGIQWVLDHKDTYGIDIINLSLVASVQSP
jgi:serine protease AprX